MKILEHKKKLVKTQKKTKFRKNFFNGMDQNKCRIKIRWGQEKFPLFAKNARGG
jgi:hypothetical protein